MRLLTLVWGIFVLLLPAAGHATGLATCDSGAQSGWQPQEAVTKHLMKAGWKEVRRMKPDGGCWEVYGLNENNRLAESYFHPVTLEHIMTTQR
jgi:hypothetical protein